jgi:predicted DNA binding protein
MCLDNVLKPSVFNEIVKKKEEHTQILIKFRNAYEEVIKTEAKIQESQQRVLSTLRSLNPDAFLMQKLTDKQLALLKTFNLN